jgi:transcriptional regulator with XRE-family HTH domain
MTSTKFFFHSNIRFLRERKRMSQEELSGQLGLSRNKLQALESGKTVNPTITDIVAFSDYFRVNMDTLLRIDLTKVTELRLQEYETRSNSDLSGKELRVIVTTVNVNGRQNIEHVPVKAKAGYLAGYGDSEYVSRLPVFSLPNVPNDKKFRSFPSEGDSMYPFPQNAIIVGEYVDDWFALKTDVPCIVVTKNEGIVFKLVSCNIHEARSLILKSLNAAYKPYSVLVNDVCEIWKYHSYISSELPERDLPLDDIAKNVKAIHNDVQRLLRKADPA